MMSNDIVELNGEPITNDMLKNKAISLLVDSLNGVEHVSKRTKTDKYLPNGELLESVVKTEMVSTRLTPSELIKVLPILGINLDDKNKKDVSSINDSNLNKYR